MGLGAVLEDKEAATFVRTLGSPPLLFPIGLEHYLDDPGLRYHHLLFLFEKLYSLIYLKKEGNNTSYRPLSIEKLLTEAGLENQLQFFNKYYLENSVYGRAKLNEQENSENLNDEAKVNRQEQMNVSMSILEPPPVNKLYVVYGTNVDTEKMVNLRYNISLTCCHSSFSRKIKKPRSLNLTTLT